MAKKSSRRKFMGQTAAIGAGYWIGSELVARAQETPLQSVAGAFIGVGAKGGQDSTQFARLGVKVVGICDVDKSNLDKKAVEAPEAQKFQDYREMLDKLGDKVDMVQVSIPDHSHAVAASKAMKMKKHVFVQKPLTWSIHEARYLRETAAQMGVVTQMGNQGSAENGLREAVEVVKSGAIGDVSEVHVWSDRPIWPQGEGRPAGADPIPAELNWDAWIGPAQMRPYKAGGLYHPFNWRGWVDFGTGALGDMACHTTNLPVRALELWDPIAVTCVKSSGIVDNEQYPKNSMLKFEFPKRNGLVATDFYWYDGGNFPGEALLAKLPAAFLRRVEARKTNPAARGYSGALLVGSKGMLFSQNDYGASYVLLPDEQYKDYKVPEPTIPRIPAAAGGGGGGGSDQRHKWEFVATIKGEHKPGTYSNFGYAGRLTETMLVGILALRTGEGKRIEWDAAKMMSTNVPEANKYVRREYREGWGLS